MAVAPISTQAGAEIRPREEAQEQHTEQSFDLLVYWRILATRKWSILGLTLGITVLAALVVFSIRPTYRSTVTLLLEAQKNKVVGIEEVYSGMSANREYFQTQAEIMKSRELAAKVVNRLDLAKDPEFDPRQQEPPFWRRWLGNAGIDLATIGIAEDDASASQDDATITKGVIRSFQSRLTVEPVRLSQLVRVSFDSADPALAAKVANAVAEIFIESDLEARYQMTQKASDWLSERIGGLRQKLESSEKALQQYRDKERIVDAKGTSQSGASRQLEELTKAQVDARQRRNEAENRYNQIRNIGGASAPAYDSVPAVMGNQLVSRMREAEADAEKKYSELSNRYGREHPRMVQAESELRSARENTRKAIDTVVSSITREYEVARANEASVEKTLSQSKSEIQDINRKEFQLGILEREAAGNRQLYDMFLGRFKETNLTGGLQSTVARVVDSAVISARPFKPNKQMVTLLALVAGLFISVMLALLLDRLDSTVKNSVDVENKLGLPVLSSLPIIKSGTTKLPELIYLEHPHAMFSEAIRTARTGIMLSSIDTPHRAILVTSSVPGEGKTTVAINLAQAFAQTKRVVLIDADMRRPSVGKTFGKETSIPGLSSLVSGGTPASECIFKMEGSDLFILPSGPVPPNPLELILSKRFQETLHKLGELFDLLIIDSPPVQLVSDAMAIARNASGVVYVVKADSTPYQMARNGIKRMRQASTNLIGVALNQLDVEHADRYYGEYSGYSKYSYRNYYGADRKKPKTRAAA